MPWVLPTLAELRAQGQKIGANLTVTTVTPNVDVNGKPVPEPDEPIMDTFAPRVNAYRGSEMHGVKSGEPWDGGPQGFTDGTVPVEWDYSDPDRYVVPVRIVEDADETLNRWRTGQHQGSPTGSAPAMIVPQHRQRTRILLRNISSNASQILWITHGADMNGPFTGYPLFNNDAPLELYTHEAIYAASSDNNPCAVAFAYEYVGRVDFQ